MFLFKQNFVCGVGREQNFVWITNMPNYDLYVIIAIWEWIVQCFSSYLHDKHCIFALNLLITYKRILYVNKLIRKYNVFMSMTWKSYEICIFIFSISRSFRRNTLRILVVTFIFCSSFVIIDNLTGIFRFVFANLLKSVYLPDANAVPLMVFCPILFVVFFSKTTGQA